MIAARRIRARAAIALATIVLLLGGGVLARHHEADVAHVTDAHTGVTSHAFDTDCHDAAPITHIHALPGDRHADACSVTLALHQPVVFAKPLPLISQLAITLRATTPPLATHSQAPLLLSAPKTSPPRALV